MLNGLEEKQSKWTLALSWEYLWNLVCRDSPYRGCFLGEHVLNVSRCSGLVWEAGGIVRSQTLGLEGVHITNQHQNSVNRRCPGREGKGWIWIGRKPMSLLNSHLWHLNFVFWGQSSKILCLLNYISVFGNKRYNMLLVFFQSSLLVPLPPVLSLKAWWCRDV